MDKNWLKAELKKIALELGFELFGVAQANKADHFDRFELWLDEGCAAEMDYLYKHREARQHPESIFPEVKSVIMLGVFYSSHVDADKNPFDQYDSNINSELISIENKTIFGKIARYARGPDYHEWIRDRLRRYLNQIQTLIPDCQGRGVVDTAPLLERDFARRAGLGWFGKNTMLIHKARGSFCFLAALLINKEIEPDLPFTANHCGSCTRCLEACPTQALTKPGWLDARKCLSYWIIEHRGGIPKEFSSKLNSWLFGCDICQEVCPWNQEKFAGEITFPKEEKLSYIDLYQLLNMDENEFYQTFRHTPIWRTKREGLLRNAILLLGEQGDQKTLQVLEDLEKREDPIFRNPTLVHSTQLAISCLSQKLNLSN